MWSSRGQERAGLSEVPSPLDSILRTTLHLCFFCNSLKQSAQERPFLLLSTR